MGWYRKLFRRLFSWFEVVAIVGIAIALFVFGVGVIWATLSPLPAIENFESRRVAESTKIYDRTGNIILYDVHGSMRRTEVPIENISRYIRNATVAIEDDTFYQHNGFHSSAPYSLISTSAEGSPGRVVLRSRNRS